MRYRVHLTTREEQDLALDVNTPGKEDEARKEAEKHFRECKIHKIEPLDAPAEESAPVQVTAPVAQEAK